MFKRKKILWVIIPFLSLFIVYVFATYISECLGNVCFKLVGQEHYPNVLIYGKFYDFKNNTNKEFFVPNKTLKEINSFINATKTGNALAHDPANGKQGVEVCVEGDLTTVPTDLNNDGIDDVYGCGCGIAIDTREDDPKSLVAGTPKTYNSVEMGNKCWFSEPLTYDLPVGGASMYYSGPKIVEAQAQAIIDNGGSNNICPAGWRVPSDKDWMDLETWLGMATPDMVKQVAGGDDDYEFGGSAGGGVKVNYTKTQSLWGLASMKDVTETPMVYPTTTFYAAGERSLTLSAGDAGYDLINEFLIHTPTGINVDKSFYWSDDLTYLKDETFNTNSGVGRVYRAMYQTNQTGTQKNIEIERGVMYTEVPDFGSGGDWLTWLVGDAAALPPVSKVQVRCVKDVPHVYSASIAPKVNNVSGDPGECGALLQDVKANAILCTKNGQNVHPLNCAEAEYLNPATPYSFAANSGGRKIDFYDGKAGYGTEGYFYTNCTPSCTPYAGNTCSNNSECNDYGVGVNPNTGTCVGYQAAGSVATCRSTNYMASECFDDNGNSLGNCDTSYCASFTTVTSCQNAMALASPGNGLGNYENVCNVTSSNLETMGTCSCP